MARRKNLTPEQKIPFLQNQIEEAKAKVKELEKELAQAEEEKRQADMAQLYLEIQKQGLSIEDALSKIKE